LAIASGAVAINDYQLVIGGNGNIMISSVISGAGSLVKTGAGTLTLEGDNTYTGGTIIASGSLSIQDAGAVPTGTGLVVGEGAVSLFAAIESAASDSTVATAASPSGISAAQPVTGAQTTLATADTVAMTTASTALAAPLSKIAPPVGNTIRGAPILPVAVASNEVSPAAARADYFSRQAAILSYQAPGSDVAASLAPRSASGISVPVASVVRPPKLDDVRRLFPTAAVREQVHVAALQSYHVLPSGEWAAAFVLWDLDNVSPNSQSRNRNHHFDLEQFLGPGNTEGQ
jgi:autotransporter-associated beta strand protein